MYYNSIVCFLSSTPKQYNEAADSTLSGKKRKRSKSEGDPGTSQDDSTTTGKKRKRSESEALGGGEEKEGEEVKTPVAKKHKKKKMKRERDFDFGGEEAEVEEGVGGEDVSMTKTPVKTETEETVVSGILHYPYTHSGSIYCIYYSNPRCSTLLKLHCRLHPRKRRRRK